MDPNRNPNNYPTTPNTAYQQVYGQNNYFAPQQFQQAGFQGQGQGQQQQQFLQQQQQFQMQQQQQFQMQQQQQFPGNQQAYDANGLARQLQNQHLTTGQGGQQQPQQQRPRTAGSQASGTVQNDYVVFNRDDSSFSSSTKERAKALKLKVELHYNQSVAHAVERNQRCGRCPRSVMNID